IKESEGNLLSSMFQTAGSGAISSTTINNTNQIQGGANNLPNTLESGTFKITVNGKMHELTLAAKEDEDGNPILYTKEEVITELNAQLDAKVGKGVIVLREENGSMQMDIKGNVSVSMESEAGSLNEMLGFSDQDNQIKADSTLAELGLTGTLIIGGTSYTFQAEDTMDTIIQAFEKEEIAASFTDGKLQLSTDTHTTISGDLTTTLFQTSAVELNKPGADFSVQDGANAILVVNGQTIERSTNNFELDGFNITLTATSTEEINITAEDNVDQVFDTIVKFVNEYNALVDTITTLTSEKTEYRNYPPLTDAQKKEMSEKEIELWEEKAKTGLLANDATLNGILSQMRSVLFNQPEGSTISFANIGIESKNYSDRGKLTIDEDKLRNALQNNMSEVENLFTHPEHGVAVQLNKVIDQAAKASSSSPGSLVRIAGVKNSATAGTNNLSQRMDGYDKLIENLKRTYEMQKTRYWKQFSNLETVISKMNSQSSWLSQQLG
ncbi:MAG: flagellar filament capping protein FliD, partial [Erysipelotrichaceae bacterium]